MKLLDKYPYVASPHSSPRGREEPEACIIHYTAGTRASGSVSWFANHESKVSAHFVVSRKGDVTQCVPLDRAAWHAGVSEMPDKDGEMRGNVNKRTIGIELANLGYLVKGSGDKFYYEIGRRTFKYRGDLRPVRAELTYDNGVTVEGWWEPFPDAQIAGLKSLLEEIALAGHEDAARVLWGHEEIAIPFASRKRDPGPLFPWSVFEREPSTRRTIPTISRDH